MIRSFSFGGGVQSTAALVLAAERKIDYPLFMFANVGDEHEPRTYEYVHEVAIPFAAEHGIELVEVTRGGKQPTILGRLEANPKWGGIPVRMDRTGAPGRRSCTYDYKITPVSRELKRRGATAEAPAIVGLGISVDEVQRLRTPFDPRWPWQTKEYPLVELGLSRQDCRNVIERAGLAVPPKSSCYFCPFHSLEQWRKLKREEPELFERAAALEERLQADREEIGRDPVWLTDLGARQRVRLRELIGEHEQLTIEHVDNCDEGFCFT